jgi:hypothetical protein
MLRLFYDALQNRFLAVTTPEFKELIYYAKDAEEAERRTQALKARLPDFDITHATECKRRPRL